MKNLIIQTLRSLGVTANYRGYRQLCFALELVVEDEDRLLNIKHEVYVPIAEILHCNYKTIERNIRTVIDRVWRTNRARLFEVAGFSMEKQPTACEFIDYVANHIRCQCLINIM